jgi:CheY-like chemotaxis protein
VADTGVGIAAENLRYIFEEFSQVDGKLQRGGTGLGLPLSRRLATLMGGDVTVESELGRGSTFRLVLPLRYGQADTEGPGDAGSAQRSILVVDDEEAFRYVIRHIAQDAGYAVMEAADGQAGLRLIQDQRPALVVLDLQMPRMDGFALLDQMGASGARDIPVIICTAQSLNLEQKRSLSAAYAIVPKHDISRDGLTTLIQTVLQQRSDTP